ncbi:MAG: ABC transporter permease [Candidatus Saccharibacteria bacterium]|nr:ABC transporter permease [Rhodoferax sp.]
MFKFIASRLLQSVLVLLVMSFIIYGLIGLMPGDPIDIMVNSNPGYTAQDIARLRAQYGLDQPLTTRYWNWLQDAATLDFGYSRTYSQPVMVVMVPALVQTAKLVGVSFLVFTVVALTLGVIAALAKGTVLDRLINLLAFTGISVPVFFLALMLIYLFAVRLGWLPASGMFTIGGEGGLTDSTKYLVLPVLTLTAAFAGRFTRFTRASMVEVMRMDYIRTARAKGAGKVRVVFKHALRNALIPVVTVLALSFGALLGGALITETMFAQRGMGKLIYDAIMGNDFNLALMGLLFATAATLVSNLVADIAYAWLDPRISLS